MVEDEMNSITDVSETLLIPLYAIALETLLKILLSTTERQLKSQKTFSPD
jgi:hypothetical protein